MKTSAEGVDFIKAFEGFMPYAYLCSAGVWTIGYGHTINVKQGDTIIEEDAERLLENDLKTAEQAVTSHVTRNLTQNQFDALVSFVFNCGERAFKRSTLRKKVNAMDDVAASQQFLRWNKAGGKVVDGLTRRRNAEANMFMELPWQS